MKYDDLKADGVFDNNGWPTHMPEGVEKIATLWQWSGTPEAAVDRVGVYVLTYEGEGGLKISANQILSEEPGRIVFNYTKGNIGLGIFDTDPEGTGDYIRNISIVRQDRLELHEAGAIFNPDVVDMLKDSAQFRFMDWQETNNSEISEWSDRPTMDNFNWAQEGVPLEAKVQLANETGTDPWFSMPHGATEKYIRNFATYVRDNLDPGLTVSIEFSNETWNWLFQHTHDLAAEAKAAWGTEVNYLHYVAKLATESAMIWDEVFGAEADARLVKVLGTQMANIGITKQLLSAKAWFENEPDSAVAPADVFDAIGVTTYFGNSVAAQQEPRDALIAAIEDPEVDAFRWLADKLQDPEFPSSIPHIMSRLADQKAIAEEAGLKMVAYEGGQHVHQLFGLGAEAAALGDFFAEFVRSPEMAELYHALWDGWAEVGDGPFMQFGTIAESSKWGSWALWENLSDINPRGELLKELNEDSAQWWDAGDASGVHQQGVTTLGDDADNVLVGTAAEDYLIGGAGDDVLIGGGGNDGLHGGGGDDVLLLTGGRDDYTIVAEDGGFRLEGLEGSDRVLDVERFLFEDGGAFSLEEILTSESNAPSQSAPHPSLMIFANKEFGRADLITIDGDVVTAVGSNMRIQAIGTSTLLGHELAELDVAFQGSYFVAERNVPTLVGDVEVTAGFWTVNANRFSKNGPELLDSALEAASLQAAIVTDVARIDGSNGNDTMFGGASDDVFFGGDGRDVINTRGGNDWLSGGNGNDVMNGGDGADMFVFDAGSDRIADFSAEDTVDLSAFELSSAQALDSIAVLNNYGDLVLHFNNQDELTFSGLGLEDLVWMDTLI